MGRRAPIIIPRAVGIGAPTTSSQVNSGTVITFSHTVEDQVNNFLLVMVAYCSIASSVSSITYNGVGLTHLASASLAITGRDPTIEIWYLANPTIGSNTLTVNYGGVFGASEPGRAIALNVWGVASGTAPSETDVTSSGTVAGNSLGPNNADSFFMDCVFVNNTDVQTAPAEQTIFSTFALDNSVSQTTYSFSYRRGNRTNTGSTELDRSWTNSASFTEMLISVHG